MSDRSQTLPVPEGERFESNRFAGLSVLLGLIALVALALCVVGAFISPRQFSFSWLFAFAFFFTLCAGCFFWTIVHHATDAEWSVVVRRQLENIGSLLAVMALFFVPILLLRHHLYEWMNIPPGHEAALDTKRAYLNWNFFVVRAIIFFGLFILASQLLRRLSVRQDKDGNPRCTIQMRKVAFASLPIFALCLTFGAFDWLMSLNYHWFSTMFGVYIFAGTAGSSMSLLVLVITALRRAGYLKEVVTLEHYHIMGKWMLAFSVFWAYIGFSQYMLIWYANMPEETEYFITRNTESWWALSHDSGDWTFFWAICDLAFALDQETSASALLCRRLDRMHANARHVHRRSARAAWNRRAREHLGFRRARRDRRFPRLCLSANPASIIPFSCPRPPINRVA